MSWKPLPGRVIVTREQQLTSKVLHIIATDERGAKLADRGRVIAVGEAPWSSRRYPCGLCRGTGDRGAWPCSVCGGRGDVLGKILAEIEVGDDVFYLGPEERLAIEWEGQKAYAVSYDEVLGVVEDG